MTNKITAALLAFAVALTAVFAAVPGAVIAAGASDSYPITTTIAGASNYSLLAEIDRENRQIMYYTITDMDVFAFEFTVTGEGIILQPPVTVTEHFPPGSLLLTPYNSDTGEVGAAGYMTGTVRAGTLIMIQSYRGSGVIDFNNGERTVELWDLTRCRECGQFAYLCDCVFCEYCDEYELDCECVFCAFCDLPDYLCECNICDRCSLPEELCRCLPMSRCARCRRMSDTVCPGCNWCLDCDSIFGGGRCSQCNWCHFCCECPPPMLGDTNDDGVIDISDFEEILFYIYGQPSALDRFGSDWVLRVADIDQSGKIGFGDALEIIKYILGQPNILDGTAFASRIPLEAVICLADRTIRYFPTVDIVDDGVAIELMVISDTIVRSFNPPTDDPDPRFQSDYWPGSSVRLSANDALGNSYFAVAIDGTVPAGWLLGTQRFSGEIPPLFEANGVTFINCNHESCCAKLEVPVTMCSECGETVSPVNNCVCVNCDECVCPRGEVVPGDITRDGVVDMTDALEVLKYAIGIESEFISPFEGTAEFAQVLEICDFNENGVVDIGDSLSVLKLAIGSDPNAPQVPTEPEVPTEPVGDSVPEPLPGDF